MPNVSDFTADLSRFPRWVDLDPSSFAFCETSAQINPQQQRMKDCNSQASGLTGDARKQFMSSCLSGSAAETKKPNCVNGKPCGNSCIAKDKVCHK